MTFRVLELGQNCFYVIDENGEKMPMYHHHFDQCIGQIRALIGNGRRTFKSVPSGAEVFNWSESFLESLLMRLRSENLKQLMERSGQYEYQLIDFDRNSKTMSLVNEKRKVVLYCADPPYLHDKHQEANKIIELQKTYPTLDYEWVGVSYEKQREHQEWLVKNGYLQRCHRIQDDLRHRSEDVPVELVVKPVSENQPEKYPRIIALEPPSEWVKEWRESEISSKFATAANV